MSADDVLKISSPIDQEVIDSLVAGRMVAVSGVLFTVRDQAHLRLVKALTEGRPLPVDLKGQTIYYAGPAPARPGATSGSIGPTTASRMDAYTPALLEYGIKAMIGKGNRSLEVKEAMQIARAVYFVATGGAAAYLSQFVTKTEVIAYGELGPEAIYRLEVASLPLVVGIDAEGRSALWPESS